MVQRYQKRISGPIMDRIDIHLDVRRVPFEKLASLEGGEPSKVIRARWKRRARSSKNASPIWARPTCSSTATWARPRYRSSAAIDAAGKDLMRTAVRQLELSARAYHRVLKLARTIADLAGVEEIQTEHLAEALQYRPRGGV